MFKFLEGKTKAGGGKFQGALPLYETLHVMGSAILWAAQYYSVVLDCNYPLDFSLGPCKLVVFSPHNIALPLD